MDDVRERADDDGVDVDERLTRSDGVEEDEEGVGAGRVGIDREMSSPAGFLRLILLAVVPGRLPAAEDGMGGEGSTEAWSTDELSTTGAGESSLNESIFGESASADS